MTNASLLFFSPLVEQAIELAAQWHDATYRKGRWREEPFTAPDDAVVSIPAMAHVTMVAMTLARAGWNDETVAAAFLHDVIEDENRYKQRFRIEQLRDLMGEAVAEIVQTVSEQKYALDGSRRSWRARKEGYLAQLREGSAEALAVSLADKLHNLWSMNQALELGIDVFSHGTHRRALSEGPEQQFWFYNSVLDIVPAFADARLDPLRQRLEQELERFVTLAGLTEADGTRR